MKRAMTKGTVEQFFSRLQLPDLASYTAAQGPRVFVCDHGLDLPLLSHPDLHQMMLTCAASAHDRKEFLKSIAGASPETDSGRG